ncbi:hypothetical protein BXO88_11360 [Oribacterium sp. C9]|uniref:DUF3784 domain-containing protein n=1 Tax=Oribacterium sp. C9 TaxID=1943579 RepID=UPI00098FF11C|nr:DUF3784 domain-containing protein [Oribacterium sp. C9]OON85678.1 hypothetical protein BXO88_11360 [Oribacterium sp. C9]
MNAYFLFDLGMASIFFLTGLLFYISNGKAANLLTGYNMKSFEERKKFDENKMCKDYGKRIMFWAILFLIGSGIDIKFTCYGFIFACISWSVMFILFMIERAKRER